MYRPHSVTRRFGRPLFAAAFTLAIPLAPLGGALAHAAPTGAMRQSAVAGDNGSTKAHEKHGAANRAQPTDTSDDVTPSRISALHINATVPHVTLPPAPHFDTPVAPTSTALSSQIQTLAPAATFVVNSGSQCAAGTSEPSIDAALAAAASGDTILLCPTPNGWPVDGSSNFFSGGQYLVNKNKLTIQGVGGAQVVIDAGPTVSSVQRAGVFMVVGTGDTLRNLSLKNAHLNLTGAAVTLSGNGETLDNVTLTGNDIGAFVANGSTQFTKVNATANDRGLLVDTGSATTTNSHFDGNGRLGAQVNMSGSLTTNTSIGATTFSSNGLSGIYNDSGSAAINLYGTTADLNQIGVWILGGGSLSTWNSHFDRNAGIGVATQASSAPTSLVLNHGSADMNGQVGVYQNASTATTVDANTFTANSNIQFGINYAGPGSVSPAASGLVSVTADSNLFGFADAAPGSVLTIGSQFDQNQIYGVLIQSPVNGSVRLNTTSASSNNVGLEYESSAPLTSIGSVFNSNGVGTGGFGMNVASTFDPVVTLTNTAANGNGTAGLSDYSNSQQTIAGGTYSNNDAAKVNNVGGLFFGATNTPVTFSGITADGNGGSGLYYAENGTGAINGLTSEFNGNSDKGVRIDPGTVAKGTGSVTLNGITANVNADDGLRDINTGTATISNSHFDGNGAGVTGNNGLQFDVSALVPGLAANPISLTNVTATGNSFDGALFTVNATITINGSTFNTDGVANHTTGVGIEFISPGVPTFAGPHLTTVNAGGNDYAGLLTDFGTGFSTALAIDPSHFDNNGSYGIADSATGPISITGLPGSLATANSNGLDGVLLDGSLGNLSASFLQADGNGTAANGFGAGLEMDDSDGATVKRSNFDNNLNVGALLSTFAGGGPINFDHSTFDGNASGALATSDQNNGGISYDNSDAGTLTVTNSDISNNGNGAFGGSGVFLFGGTDTVHLKADTIVGNNAAQALNVAGIATNRGGITVEGGTVILDTAPPTGSGPYNRITGNGVGVVVTNDFGTVLSGQLVANDLSNNKQAGIEITGNPDLSGGVNVRRNSIYGSAFGGAPTTVPPALPAQPASPTYPFFGYVNFGTGNGLALDGNYFGINTPSTLAIPTATVANYVDIGGKNNGTSGNFIKVGVVLNSPTSPVPANSTVTVQATATLQDLSGHTVLDGTPVNFFVTPSTSAAAPNGTATTVNGVASTTFSYVTPGNPGPGNLALNVWATAPDRAAAKAVGTIAVLQQNCKVSATLRGPYFNGTSYVAEPSIDVTIGQAYSSVNRLRFASVLGSVDVQNAQTVSCANVGTTTASVTIAGTAFAGSGAYTSGDKVTSTLAYSSPTTITEVTDIWGADNSLKGHSTGTYNVGPLGTLTTS